MLRCPQVGSTHDDVTGLTSAQPAPTCRYAATVTTRHSHQGFCAEQGGITWDRGSGHAGFPDGQAPCGL